jgi:anti-sigma regulatory factor (Ser/Thr protein kinase)
MPMDSIKNKKVISQTKQNQCETSRKSFEYVLQTAAYMDSDTKAYENCLKEHVKDFEPNVHDIWAYSFSEMINNAMEHAMSDNIYVTVEQDYLKTRVIIRDDGIGIFEKIKTFFNFPSYDEAICELFKGKLTTDAEHHLGNGIFFTSRMMDVFYIISKGRKFTNNRFDDSEIRDISDEISGTCVSMSLSNYTHKKSYEIFDEYADVDGGFEKTRLPLKNIFDASPVSRSQAKRVCNRLDKFKEVELDFEGLDWMGQGFAHQIFVVFQREHPDILLVPVNMSEKVEVMYRHATA